MFFASRLFKDSKIAYYKFIDICYTLFLFYLGTIAAPFIEYEFYHFKEISAQYRIYFFGTFLYIILLSQLIVGLLKNDYKKIRNVNYGFVFFILLITILSYIQVVKLAIIALFIVFESLLLVLIVIGILQKNRDRIYISLFIFLGLGMCAMLFSINLFFGGKIF